MTEYRVERIVSIEQVQSHASFLLKVGDEVSEMYGNKFDWENFALYKYAWTNWLVICKKGGKPVGLMAARLFGSIFDDKTKILYQDLLYAQPGTRAAKYLLESFIDFGKSNADHIISCIGQKSNIKPRSLEKKGFVKLEELYRIEV